MKKILIGILIVVFALTLNSCLLTLDAQGKFSNSTINNYITNINGNGNVLSFNRSIAPYSDLQIDGPFDIQVDTTLASDEIRLECDENLANYVETNVEDETLFIKAKDNIHFQNMTKLRVYVPK